MSNTFIPLIPNPAPGPVAPDNLVPLPAPRSPSDKFAGLAPNSTAPVPAPTAASPPPPQHAPPTVTFKRDGDRVTQIEIRCSCGEVIQLDCDYSGSAQG
jgi:hypothetical protein